MDYLTVQRSVDSDDYPLSTSCPSSVQHLIPATSDDQSKMASLELVPIETNRNARAFEDTEFVEQMWKLSVSKEDGIKSTILSDYLQQAGISSLKAKSFIEWLYLHDGTLIKADKVCIGYETDTPDQAVYLALYSSIVPKFLCYT